MTCQNGSQYRNKNEELYAKIYIKYIYDNMSQTLNLKDNYQVLKIKKKRNIKQRYEQVVPLFD